MRGRVGPEAPIERFMHTNPPRLTPEQPLSEAIALLLREELEILPVVATDGSHRVVGVISPIEIFRHAMALRRPSLTASA
jgi:CBS domain-containing protein